ncbi:MAG: hypothetical protein PHG48_07275 [Eubacteriales bacterium]|nr:hypothetical protein [Eubacteriales bacterium]
MARKVLGLHPDCRYFQLGGDEVALFKECRKCSEYQMRTGVHMDFIERLLTG